MKKILCFTLFLFVLNLSSNCQKINTVTLSDTKTYNDSIQISRFSSTGTIDSSAIQVDTVDLKESTKDTIPILYDSLIKNPGKEDTISLVLVGDIMLGTNYPSANYLPPGNNCNKLLDSVRQFLINSDITIGNLEGVFAGEEGTAKNCKDPKTCYVFRMPDEYVNCLVDAGFDILSVANNHVNDFGYMGRMHSAQVLKQSGLNFAGFMEYPFTIIEHDSLKIGFCAFAPHSGVLDMRDISKAEEIVRYLSDSCDIVLVSMHAGAEGQDFQHVTRKSEVFLGADRGNVYDFAHRMIDAGADVIIGHGPHVTRAMEIYNNRLIAYSLGNFCTYSRFNLSGPNGIAPLIQLSIDSEGQIISGNIIPIRQIGEGGATIDPEKKVVFKLQDLMYSDFPNGILSIGNDGSLKLLPVEKKLN